MHFEFDTLIVLELLMVFYGIGLLFVAVRKFLKEKKLDKLILLSGIVLILAGLVAISFTQN